MNEDELRHRIADLGPKALAVLAEKLGVLPSAETNGSNDHSREPEPPPAPVAPQSPPPPTAGVPDLDFPEQDVDALIEQLLERTRTPAQGTPARGTPARSTPARSTPARGTPARSTPARSTPAQRPREFVQPAETDVPRSKQAHPPSEEEYLRERQTDAMLATLFLLEEEGIPLHVKTTSPRLDGQARATHFLDGIEQLGGFVRALQERPCSEAAWREFVVAVSRFWDRNPAEKIAPAAVARVGTMLLIAGLLAETSEAT